jgi:hypothetical protein
MLSGAAASVATDLGHLILLRGKLDHYLSTVDLTFLTACSFLSFHPKAKGKSAAYSHDPVPKPAWQWGRLTRLNQSLPISNI